MRKLTANTFVTLDGVMQAPGGPEEDPTGGFALGGWSVNYWDDVMGRRMDAYMGKPFDLLLGRRTYEIFAAHWPYSKEEPTASALNGARKHVASRTLRKADWQNSTIIQGDVPTAVATLKREQGPEIQVHGSSNLLQTLWKHHLIDEFQVMIFPVVVGPGKRLFGDGAVPAGLRLVESEVSTTGVVIAKYERAGAVNVGSFAAGEPSAAEVERRRRLEVR